MLFRSLFVAAVIGPVLSFAQPQTDTTSKALPLKLKSTQAPDSFYQRGLRAFEVVPMLGLLVSKDEQRYGIGSVLSYGFFVRDRLLLRAGLLYDYSWLRGVPERFNAHTIGPMIGLTYHIPNKWRLKPYLAAEARYDFFSYLPEGRFVFFDDKPDGKRVWHTAPAVRLTGGFMYHTSKRSSVGFNVALEKQFYRKDQIPLSHMTANGFTDGWQRVYFLTYRYTLRP